MLTEWVLQADGDVPVGQELEAILSKRDGELRELWAQLKQEGRSKRDASLLTLALAEFQGFLEQMQHTD